MKLYHNWHKHSLDLHCRPRMLNACAHDCMHASIHPSNQSCIHPCSHPCIHLRSTNPHHPSIHLSIHPSSHPACSTELFATLLVWYDDRFCYYTANSLVLCTFLIKESPNVYVSLHQRSVEFIVVRFHSQPLLKIPDKVWRDICRQTRNICGRLRQRSFRGNSIRI